MLATLLCILSYVCKAMPVSSQARTCGQVGQGRCLKGTSMEMRCFKHAEMCVCLWSGASID